MYEPAQVTGRFLCRGVLEQITDFGIIASHRIASHSCVGAFTVGLAEPLGHHGGRAPSRTRDAPNTTITPMTDIADQWLGTGFRFPLMPDTQGRLGYIAGMDVVRQSIETILDTEPGERIMRPSFGCGLRRYLMAPNILTTRSAMAEDITTALTTWEPRIQLNNVSVTPDDNPVLVWIEISYVRLADLREDNLVFPFYLS